MKILTAMMVSVGLMAFCAAEDWHREPVVELATVQGLMKLDRVGKTGYGLFVAGHHIAELEAFSLGIAGTFPPKEPVQYVLFNIETGGGSCATIYRLLDLTPGKKPYLTGEFGNCTSSSVLSQENERIRIDFPGWNEFKAKTFFYDPARRRLKQAPKIKN